MSRGARAPALAALAIVAAACERDAPPDLAAGQKTYAVYCAACHGPAGEGNPGGGPPLAGSSWVAGPEGRLIRILLHGLRGEIEVRQATYNREMLAFGPVLSDAQIAAVLSHVRDRFGAPSPPVQESTVRRARAQTRDRQGYWTAQELLQVE
jgi:mono/diheme cytochrome c family protein